MNMEMFLFIVALILRIHSVRTDDYDIETTEMGTSEYAIPTATSFLRKADEAISKKDFVDEKKMPHRNFDPDVYDADVWNQKPYRPFTLPPNMPNIDFANWKPPTINLEDITVPPITYGRRSIKDYKLFFAIFSVVILVMVTLKLLLWLRLYCKSKELQRRILLIRNGSDSSLSDTVPSNRSIATSAPNRSVLLHFPDGLDSSNSASRSQQTERAVQKSDSKRIVILIPVNSRKDDTKHPQQSYAKDSRFDSCKEGLTYSEPPPPYQ